MKWFLIGLQIWAPVCVNICLSQSLIEGFIGIDLSIPIQKTGEESGLAQYEINSKSHFNKDLNGGINCWIFGNLGISFGIGVYDKTYFVNNQVQVDELNLPLNYNGERRVHYIASGPAAGLAFKHGRFRSGAFINQLFLFKNYKPAKLFQSAGFRDFSSTPQATVIQLTEITDIILAPTAYTSFHIYVQYKIISRLGFKLEYEGNLLFVNKNHYSLQIIEYPEAHENDITILRDFHISNKYHGLNFGIYYLMGQAE